MATPRLSRRPGDVPALEAAEEGSLTGFDLRMERSSLAEFDVAPLLLGDPSDALMSTPVLIHHGCGALVPGTSAWVYAHLTDHDRTPVVYPEED